MNKKFEKFLDETMKKLLDGDGEIFKYLEKKYKQNLQWSKDDIVKEFFRLIPDFGHKETGKYLDGKM